MKVRADRPSRDRTCRLSCNFGRHSNDANYFRSGQREWRVVTSSRVSTFNDPQPYQEAVRPAQLEVLVTSKGTFRAELMQIALPRLWLQSCRENLPRVFSAGGSAVRPPIYFLADAKQPSEGLNGLDLSFGEIFVTSRGSMNHHQSRAPCHWVTMSLTPEDLASAGHALAGRELTPPTVAHRLRPALPLMARLLKLRATAGRLAETAPDILTRPEVARSLEQALVHAMVMCLTAGTPIEMSGSDRRHNAVMARFEEFLSANLDRPVYLAEVCAAVGASERTLRICCQAHLGMGPIRYLCLRRLHLARRALMRANPELETVTEIATEYGFWELGRFSVEYRALFGESPSATLRRAPDDWWTNQDRPIDLPISGFTWGRANEP